MNTYQDTYKHKGLRKQLVETVKAKGIKDPNLLRAILLLPRHFFLPMEFESHAYEDKAFPIGENQTISQPYTVAYQTELLQLKPHDKVLEIGTGSGYQGAILSLCGAEVYSIERHAKLSESAKRSLKAIEQHTDLKIHLNLFVGDGSKGLQAHQPFDKILVTAGAPSVPKALIEQLKTGGTLVIPVGKKNEVQRMLRIKKLDNQQIETEVFDTFSFVPLLGENGWNP